jgi:ABC-type multidrug transport system fused ATPase/permease subunit
MFLNCFLVLMLSAAITIPQTFRERVTLFKHRSAEFYSGRVAYVTQVLLDIPLSVLEAVLLSVLSYFWVGMREGGNHFMFFLGTLIGLEFVGQAFGRLLCAISRKQVHANSLSSVFILVFGTVASFMPGYDDIPPILRWLSWITPAAYAFEGIMINEFEGRNISAVVLPNTDGSVDAGSIQGADWLNNFGLPRQAYASPQGIKNFDVVMLFVISLVCDLAGCYFVENTRDRYFNKTRRPQREVHSVEFEAQRSGASEAETTVSKDLLWPKHLAVKGLCYYVPLKGKHVPRRFSVYSILGPCLIRLARKEKGKRNSTREDDDKRELQLLQGVDARFEAGKMTALMGTRQVRRCYSYLSFKWIPYSHSFAALRSGAGKTTLLDVIAGYKTGGRITGEVLIDGQPQEKDIWKRIWYVHTISVAFFFRTVTYLFHLIELSFS